MEATRIIKKIGSDRLPELNAYKGKSVEIIILPYLSKKKSGKNKIEHLINRLLSKVFINCF